ncbi:MAG: S41 family peptidase [Clostridium sp.]
MSSSWKNKWIEDIDILRNTLVSKHKNLFFNITRECFEENIDNLKNMVEKLDYNDMKVEISRVIASVGDSHTAVKLPVKYIFPMEFYWFKEGIYVVYALEEYKKIEFSKVIEINNTSIEDIIDELSQIISHENKSYLKANIVNYIQAIELLYGLMIVDNIDNCIIKFENLKGEIITQKVNSIEIIKYHNLKSVENNKDNSKQQDRKINYSVNKTIANNTNKNRMPMYRRNSNRNYWFEYLEKENLLYFKYNACREDSQELMGIFILKLISVINKNNMAKLVIDLRNNSGGDSRLLEPFIEYIKNNRTINKEGKLFVVIGRDTFSSALLNAFELKNKTNAILIGESTGGKPNCYGEIEKFTLPNSKFLITYSTEYYKLIHDDNCESLFPHINIEIGIIDFINGKDPVLEYLK